MSLHDYEPAVRYLRSLGCRCVLMWDGKKPVPFGGAGCEKKIEGANRRDCWFIDSLTRARIEETTPPAQSDR